LIDTAYPVATPEGVALTLRVAGPVPRALAWFIDFFWRVAVMLAAFFFLGMLEKFGMGIALLLWFVLEWLVPAWCEVKWGATPGKRVVGLRVLHDDGTPVSWRSAMIRNLLRTVDFLPFAYSLGLCVMLFNRQFKRLGDMAANTVVVHVDEQTHVVPELQAELARAPAFALNVEEQRLILSFAERSSRLSEARAEELADLAVPLVNKTYSTKAQLLGIARHLSGR
jgi:uncharacterized RDD family membrane protein YckC